MKMTQLANVLIKILGLSVSIHAVPQVLNGLFNLTLSDGRGMPHGVYWFLPVPSIVLLVGGLCLIVKSRCIAEYLFRGEE